MAQFQKQHFIPQFYLRNFSDETGRQISLLNAKTGRFVSGASIRHQAQRRNLYENVENEKLLGSFEGAAAPIIRNVIETHQLPEKGSFSHFILVAFLILMHARTPTHMDEASHGLAQLMREAIKGHPDANDLGDLTNLSFSGTLEMHFSAVFNSLPYAIDLQAGLIQNKTNTPFVTSDHPCVFWNPFLERKVKWASITGVANKGLVITLPLTPFLCLVLFDDGTYKLGGRSRILSLNNLNNIRDINVLQGVNCSQLLFGGSGLLAPGEMRRAIETAKPFRSSRCRMVGRGMVVDSENDSQGEMLHYRKWEPRINLEIPGFRLLKKATRYQLTGSAAEPRNPELFKKMRGYEPSWQGSMNIDEVIDEIRKEMKCK
ncbi:DUF4238 domain-containing protein [Phycisphaerales bacterium AB-hyl4]|uniref:DUF4238 domain-containing protein n=1 Tax=Natronomicrosphaera hydrolytica TaxID=3242702 RepID=A0ABV4U2X4_9BACT